LKPEQTLVLMIITALIIAVISFIVLPDPIVIQVGMDGKPASTVPKIIGVLLPLAFVVIGAYNHYKPGTSKRGGLILLAVGYIVGVFTLVVNL